ncbi:MAG: TRAP transporter small permease [Burkholderiaceae bacterium]|nr:TRAP transporter small permease [Burkholderiaceae bacterium]MCX8004105.1 TRAP transporter small permease [Burkholderiaceae bacterium]
MRTVLWSLKRAVARLCAAVLYVTLGVIFAILCGDVALRYFAGSSLRWAAELPELLFPWLVMAGVVLAAQHGAHIATSFLADRLRGRARTLLAALGHAAIVAAYGLLALVTARALPIVADERSPILQVPGAVTYGCLLGGFLLIALVHLGELLGVLRPDATPGAQGQP